MRTAGADKRTAGADGRTAGADMRTAGADKRTAGADGRTAGADMRTAGADGRTAGADMRTAGADKRTAGADSQWSDRIMPVRLDDVRREHRIRKAGNQEKRAGNSPFLPSCQPDLSFCQATGRAGIFCGEPSASGPERASVPRPHPTFSCAGGRRRDCGAAATQSS